VPRADNNHALEVGERVYLREPTGRDQVEIVTRNSASRALHRGWVTPPTETHTFAEWLVRCRKPNVQCFLVCRLEDGAIAEPRVGVGGAEPRPRRIAQAEAALAGRAPGAEVFQAAADAAADAVDPLEDHTTSADYRRSLVRTLTRRALERAAASEACR